MLNSRKKREKETGAPNNHKNAKNTRGGKKRADLTVKGPIKKLLRGGQSTVRVKSRVRKKKTPPPTSFFIQERTAVARRPE